MLFSRAQIGVLLLGMCLPVLPAADHRTKSPASDAEYRVDANLVIVPVSVTDAQNHPITGLTRANFRVFDGGVEQRIVQLTRDETPMAVGLVFDTSLSMASQLQAARAAAASFLATANPEDEFFLVEFQDQAQITQSFTNDPRDIGTRLAQTRAKGHTALLDAVRLGIDHVRKSSKPRKALLVLSDGGDNHSRFTERELAALVRESDVLIYSMGVSKPARKFLPEQAGDGQELLEAVTRQSGGRLYVVDEHNGLAEVAARIGQELHNRYVLSYAPSNERSDGKYHKVQVKVTPPEGVPGLQVSWRPGYVDPGL